MAVEGAASDTLLSDMAWTAATGRSHFGHRAGVVFQDAVSLRRSLTAHAQGDAGPGPRTATKVAFVYTGETDQWVGMGGALYAREPVVRAVLNRCDAVLGEERGASLLDAMFGGPGAEGGLSDPVWARPATYALACALTALWASVGIRPSVVAGQGAGEIAAAQAAGVFGLEDGLRLAAAGGDAEAALEGVAIAAPSVALVSSLTGRVMDSDQAPDGAYWRRQTTDDPASPSACAETLAALGVEVVIEIGRDAVLAPLLAEAWPKAPGSAAAPTLLSSLRQSQVGEEEAAGHADGDFVEAVARAYEAGLGVSFAGLFAGETRRRISLPGYPFQRRCFWLPKPGRQTAASD